MSKPMKRLTLKEQVRDLISLNSKLNMIINDYGNQLRLVKEQNQELLKDKQWLKLLVQDLSSAINNGAKEGSFPRR